MATHPSSTEVILKKLALFLLSVSFASATFGQSKHTPTIDEQLSLHGILPTKK